MNTPSKQSNRPAASALLFVFALWAVINAADSFGWNEGSDLPTGPAVTAAVRGPVAVVSVSPRQALPSPATLPIVAGQFAPTTTRRWEQADELRRWVECVNAYHAERLSRLLADPPAARSWHARVPDPLGGCGPVPSDRWGAGPGRVPAMMGPWSSVGAPARGASR